MKDCDGRVIGVIALGRFEALLNSLFVVLANPSHNDTEKSVAVHTVYMVTSKVIVDFKI